MISNNYIPISIHVLREEDDDFFYVSSYVDSQFQSTSSARRTTRCDGDTGRDDRISIHVLREEDDE